MFSCCMDKKVLEQVANNKVLLPVTNKILTTIPEDEETVSRIAAHVSAVINVSRSLSFKLIDVDATVTEELHDVGPEFEEPEFVPIVVEPVTEPVAEPITVPVIEPVTVPVTEPVTEPVEPITIPVTEPITIPEPVIERSVTPVSPVTPV